MNIEEISKLRDYLHLLISKNADYSDILKSSKELDEVILEFYQENLKGKSIENNNPK
ncbi:Spo0E family sporulation regulatory protein-aspartic acid phosphatase [Clostridium sp. LBM24168]